jgi:rubredoxin
VRAVMCAVCGFLFGEEDDPAAYGFSCPRCGARAPKAVVDLEGCPWWVLDASGQPVAGPFAEPEVAERWAATHHAQGHPRGPLGIGRRPAPGHVPAPAELPRPEMRAAPERVAPVIDRLDVLLALWIAQAMVGTP